MLAYFTLNCLLQHFLESRFNLGNCETSFRSRPQYSVHAVSRASYRLRDIAHTGIVNKEFVDAHLCGNNVNMFSSQTSWCNNESILWTWYMTQYSTTHYFLSAAINPCLVPTFEHQNYYAITTEIGFFTNSKIYFSKFYSRIQTNWSTIFNFIAYQT